MKLSYIKIITLFLVFHSNLFASELHIQHGGEIGRVSFGISESFGRYQLQLFYGYHPEVNTIALKNSFDVYTLSKFDLNIGISIFAVDKFKNNNIPSNYYEQSIDKRLYLFYSIDYNYRKNFSFYFENGINDVNAETYYNNNIPLDDLMSIGFGISVTLF